MFGALRSFGTLGRSNGIFSSPGGSPPNVVLFPSAIWNGTAGSGFAGAPPSRTGLPVNGRSDLGWMHGTVAPAAQFVWPLPVDEMFTEDSDVMVSAWAASAGGNVIGGIASVTFFCEGNAVIVTEPTVRLIEGRNQGGGTEFRPAEVWAATLDWSQFPSDGAADLYATIQPTLAGVAVRTIGPVRVFRKSGFNRTIDISPSLAVVAGSRYQSVQAALAFLNTNGVNGEHVRLRWTENGFIDPSLIAFTNAKTNTNGRRGQVVVDANGFDVLTRRSTGSFTTFDPLFNGIVFRGVRFDLANISQMTSDDGLVNTGFRSVLIERGEVFSTSGATELPSNGSRSPRTVGTFDTEYFLRANWMHDFNPGSMNLHALIGNYVDTLSSDLVQARGRYSSDTLFHSPLIFMNDGENVNEDLFKTPVASIGLTYSGTGTATYSISGAVNVSTRTLTLLVNGSPVRTIASSTTIGSGIYQMQDAVNDINTALGPSGWTATLLDNTRRFAAICQMSVPPASTVTGAAVGAGVTLGAGFDVHVDMLQFQAGQNQENIIVYGNRFVGIEAQVALLTNNPGFSAYNWAMVNNGYAPGSDSDLKAQMSGTHRHGLFVSNSMIGHSLTIRRVDTNCDFDSFSRFVANVVETFSQDAPALGTFNAFTKGNIQTHTPGNAVTGPNVFTALVASDAATVNYPDIFTTGFTFEDFQPANGGFVAVNPVARQTLFDVLGNARGVTSVAGIHFEGRSAIDFTVSNSTVSPTWGLRTVGNLTPVGAPLGSYFILLEGTAGVGDESGVAVVNG